MAIKAEVRKYEYYHSPSFLMGKLKTVETGGASLKARALTSGRGPTRKRRATRRRKLRAKVG